MDSFYIHLTLVAILIGSPYWVPVCFLCYAFGKRKFSLQSLFVATAVEAIVLAHYLWWVSGPVRDGYGR